MSKIFVYKKHKIRVRSHLTTTMYFFCRYVWTVPVILVTMQPISDDMLTKICVAVGKCEWALTLIYSSFPEMHKISNVGIFVLLKFENELETEINHSIFNSENHEKCEFVLKLAVSWFNCFQFIYIKSSTKMPIILQTLCITGKLYCYHKLGQCY